MAVNMKLIPHSLLLICATSLIGLAGCGSVEKETDKSSASNSLQSKLLQNNSPQGNSTVSFIAFGDAGYHHKYQSSWLANRPFLTKQDFIDDERRSWIRKNRPIEEFVPSPLHFHKEIGGYIMKSGQQPVADAMKAWCETNTCEFAMMPGDNIYPNGATLGADGKDDSTRFQDIFVTPYQGFGDTVQDFKIYTALGNHDWHTSREGAMAQVDFLEASKKYYMDGIIYQAKPPAGNGEVELFIIDTEVLLSGVDVPKNKLNEDGSEKRHNELDKRKAWTSPATEQEKNMVAWLDDALKASTAKWKIVMGHHPLWASGGTKFEQGHVLRGLILPSLCRYADVYVAGHEHTLEVHTDSCETVEGVKASGPLVQILSGAGGKQRSINSKFKIIQDTTYPQMKAHFVKSMVWGFSHIEITGDEAKVKMISTPNDASGTPVVDYSFSFKQRQEAL